jgi:hypothetical protein
MKRYYTIVMGKKPGSPMAKKYTTGGKKISINLCDGEFAKNSL